MAPWGDVLHHLPTQSGIVRCEGWLPGLRPFLISPRPSGADSDLHTGQAWGLQGLPGVCKDFLGSCPLAVLADALYGAADENGAQVHPPGEPPPPSAACPARLWAAMEAVGSHGGCGQGTTRGLACGTCGGVQESL